MSISRLGDFVERTAWNYQHRRQFTAGFDRDRPRLLVDLSVIRERDAQTGIQRVVRAVWSELISAELSHFDVVPVYANARHGYCIADEEIGGVGFSRKPASVVRAHANDVFLGLDLSAQFVPAYRQQIRAWRRAGTKINIIAYDLLPLLYPEYFESRAVSRFKQWFGFIATDSDQIFCISRQVGHDVREWLKGAHRPEHGRPAIRYLRMGSDMAASRPSTGVSEDVLRLLDRMRFRPTILMVGTIEPRKGYDVALLAFEHLWTQFGGDAPDVVIVGKPGWKTAALQQRLSTHPEHGRRLHWVSSASDEGLCRLYDACRGLLMTSHAEGFGLPLLEAANHHRHALARDLPVFREHNLANVSFFEDDQPEVLGKAIVELSSRGATRASAVILPTWSETVAELITQMGIAPSRECLNCHAIAARSC